MSCFNRKIIHLTSLSNNNLNGLMTVDDYSERKKKD